jgi:hypothetical protein
VASGHLTSSVTTDEFIGMELSQYRVKNRRLQQQQNCRTEPRSPVIAENWTTLISGGEFLEILRFSKTFFKHQN